MLGKSEDIDLKDNNWFEKLKLWGAINMGSMGDKSTRHMAEMLLQSHAGSIDLLPALPASPAYANGSFRGFRARGGVTVDAAWKEGRVTSVTLLSGRDQTVKLCLNGLVQTVSLSAGIPYAVTC